MMRLTMMTMTLLKSHKLVAKGATMRKTKTNRLLNALATGKEMTTAQIVARFGILNPSSAVHRLREQGEAIYTNTYNTKRGVVKKYRLGVAGSRPLF